MQHSSGSTDDAAAPTPEEIAGRELRRLRTARGWSQEEVAQRMAAYGYDWHQTTVGRIEAAQRPLRLNEAVDVCRLFGIALERLMWHNPDLTPEDVDERIMRARQAHREAEHQVDRIRAEAIAARGNLENLERHLEMAQASAAVAASELSALERLRKTGKVTG